MENMDTIVVTHFINPHLFWYHVANEFKVELQAIKKMESKLQLLYKQKLPSFDSQLNPQVGDLVAVLYLNWNKFIRVEILHRPHNEKENFIVWSIDYGFPFLTAKATIHPIPNAMTKRFDYIRRGGIINIIPTTTTDKLDFQENVLHVRDQCAWSQEICNNLQEKLSNASLIRFADKFQTLHRHHWGNFYIVDFEGKSLNIKDYLVEKRYGFEIHSDFESVLHELKTTNIPRWKTNDHRVKLKTNFEIFKRADVIKQSNATTVVDKFSRGKIEDKCARNVRQVHLLGAPSNIENFHSSVLGDSTNISDSVSAMNQHQQCKQQQQQNKNIQNTENHSKHIYHNDDKHHFKNTFNDKGLYNHSNKLNIKLKQYNNVNELAKLKKISAKGDKREEKTIFKRNVEAVNFTEYLNVNHSNSSASSLSTNRPIQVKYHKKPPEKPPKQCFKEICTTLPIDRVVPTKSMVINFNNNNNNNSLQLCAKSKGNADMADKEVAGGKALKCKNNNHDNFRMDCNNFRIKPPPSHLKSFKEISKQIEISSKAMMELNPHENCKFLPAGFDVTRLNKYRDEDNHWHRKPTARYDNMPHDDLTTSSTSAIRPTSTASTITTTASTITTTILDVTRKMKSEVKTLVLHQQTVATAITSPLSSSQFTENVPAQKQLTIDDAFHQRQVAPVIKYQKTISVTIASNETTSTLLKEIPKHSDDQIAINKLKSPTKQIKNTSTIFKGPLEEKENAYNNKLDLQLVPTNKNKSVMATTATTTITMTMTTSTINSIASITEAKENNTLTRSQMLMMLETLPLIETISNNKNDNCKDNPREVIMKESECLPIVKGEVNLTGDFVKDLILAHSSVPLNPINNIMEASFCPEIHEAMLRMRITNILRSQAYSWSHILRGNSYFLINPRKSGKTWSYLPAICSLVCYRTANQTPTYGPIAIIIVASTKHVEQVTEISCRLLNDFKSEAPSVIASFGLRNFVETKLQLLDACGLFITTPSSFLRLIKHSKNEPLFDTKRLQHIVIDDMDCIQNQALDDLQACLKVILKICKKPSSLAQDVEEVLAPQLIVTSRDWDGLMARLIRISNQPLLVIGDFLEAAVYGRAVISIKLCTKSQKAATILKFIKQQQQQQIHQSQCRTIIICRNDIDVQQIKDYLENCGYPSIGCFTDYTEKYNTLHIIDEWKKKISDQILVCTDSRLSELRIRNALNLIHYSMPASWTKFTQRFSVLAHSYENLVHNKFKSVYNENNNDTDDISVVEVVNARPHSLILLDEENNIHLPRLVEFMVSHNQTVHPDILAVAKRERRALEEARISEGALLCPKLLEFGECIEPGCTDRHELIYSDVVTPADDIPTNGEMRVHVLKVFSPTHYVARLLEHKPINSTKWLEVRRSSDAAKFLLNLNKHYKDPTSLTVHWPPKLNDICIYMYSDSYRRARIIKVPPLDKNVNIVVNNYRITIKLIDDGIIVPGVKCGDLLQCHEKFIDFPALAIDLRLCNVVPHDNELTWDTKAIKQVEKWIIKDVAEDHILQVNINYALAETIWINNLLVMEKMNTVGTYIQLINIKKALIKKEFGVSCNGKNGKSIREVLEENIAYLKANNSKSNGNNSVCNNTNQITLDLSSESNQSNNLLNVKKNNDEIAKSKEESTQATQKEAQECSMKSNENTLNKVSENPDNGDDNDMKMQNNGSWCELTLNEMTSVEIGDESDNGNWEDIFLQLADNEHINKFNQLNSLIKQHIEKQQQQQQQQQQEEELDDDEEQMQNDGFLCDSWKSLKPLHDCIIKCNNLYLRARLCGIFGNEPQEYLYRFFLCDYAYFVTVKAADFENNDFYYETTEEIINFTPYQAIHCTLAGIEWNRFCKRYQVTKNYLYACGVVKNNIENRSMILRDLSINSYKILLYECEKYDDFVNAQMFNLILLEKGITESDPDTKHFLEYTLQIGNEENNDAEHEKTICNYGNNVSDNNVVSLDELLKCLDNALDEDLSNFLESFGCIVPSDQQRKQQKQQNAVESENQKKVERKEKNALEEVDLKKTKTKSETKGEPKTKTLKNNDTNQNIFDKVAKEETDENSVTIPPLKFMNKRPDTTWYETDYLICISIHVPDVYKYYLKVTESSIQFATTINNTMYVLMLNLLGCVVPELVSHEIRGLNVLVRLVKCIYMRWPRLLYEDTKYSWLKYNYDIDDDVDIAEITHNDFKHMPSVNYNDDNIVLDHSDGTESESDSETAFYQTYNQIYNEEDNNDPLL